MIMPMRFVKKCFLPAAFLLLAMLASCSKSTPSDSGTPPVVVKAKLLAPGNLQIVSLSATEASLTWTDNSTNETAFIIEQSTDSVTFAQAASVAANTVTATVKGTFLTVNTYYFRVKAQNADTMTAPTNLASKTLLPAPDNFQIVSFSPGQVSLKWSDNSSNETAFVIERAIDSLQYVAIDSTTANTTSKIISGSFDSSRTYSFRVFARSTAGRSAYSTGMSRTLGAWVYVPAGTFQMGRADGYQDERQVHSVTLSGYYIGKYEVTVKEYRTYMTAVNKTFPVSRNGAWVDDNPMVDVSWNDAAAYCAWLDSTSVKGARLPTEAEWEYAARGGANTRHLPYSGSANVGEVAWYYLNSSNGTSSVGKKLPNELGIYDMSGNAFEWCNDWFGSYSLAAQTNPKGPIFAGTNKVFRGGSWFNYGLDANDCRVETRYQYTPGSKTTDSGFRIVKSR